MKSLILRIKIKDILFMAEQKPIEITADGRGVRLDVYVEDETQTLYDIEMQPTMQSNLSKRSRYYQGMVDLNLIERGAEEVIKARTHTEWRVEYMSRMCEKNFRRKTVVESIAQREKLLYCVKVLGYVLFDKNIYMCLYKRIIELVPYKHAQRHAYI